MKDEIVRGGIRKDIHFCAGGSGKDTCQVRIIRLSQPPAGLVIFMQQCKLTLIFKGDSGGALVCRIHPFSEAQREIQCKGLYLQGNIS